MISKGIRTFGCAALLLTLVGCGGGGGGSRPNNSDPNPDPVDPGPQTSELEVTATGLVVELTVTWQGQTITLGPNRLTARAEAPGSETSPPEYESPQYQNCTYNEISKIGNKSTLAITCAQPDTLQLQVTINGLSGELSVQWFDQDRNYDNDVTGDIIEIRPGRLVEPSITAVPELQNCTDEFTSTANTRIFIYNVTCTDRLVTNKIQIDGALPYPVTLTTAGQEPLIVQNQSTQFPSGSSPLDDVVITGTGGTQQCELEKLGSSLDEQSWSLSCREYLVYSDTRVGQSGVYLIYRNGERLLLEPGDVGSQVVKTFTSLTRQAVLHPDFGVKTLSFSPSGVTWQSPDQIPTGKIQETLITDNFAYTIIITEEPDGSHFNAWSIGENLAGEELLADLITPEDQLSLLPVSPRSDAIGLDHILLGSRNVQLSKSGYAPKFAWNISQRDGVLHMVQVQGPPFPQPVYWQFYPNESSGRLDAYVSGALQPISDFHPDAQSNIVTWYDEAGDERVLLLGEGIGGVTHPRQLVELDIVTDISWEIPLDLPFPERLGYMGTDDRGRTLVITTNDLEDGLAVIANSRGMVDLEALRREAGITGQLRIRPLEKENAGGTHRKAQLYNGWLLMFEGDATGTVWLTNGGAEHTWQVDSNVTWTAFRGGAYRVVAAGANMAAVSYEKNNEQELTLLGIIDPGV